MMTQLRRTMATATGQAFLLEHASRMARRFNASIRGVVLRSRLSPDLDLSWAPSGERMVELSVEAFAIRRRGAGDE